MNNRVRRRVITISFEVWEPLTKMVDAEMDKAIRAFDESLTHAGNFKATWDEFNV